MAEDLDKILEEFETRMTDIHSLLELEEMRVLFLGKKGKLTSLLKTIGNLGVDEKKEIGKQANLLKEYFENQIKAKNEELTKREIEQISQADEAFDITLPGKDFPRGSLHPITIVQKEIENIFTGMGFRIVDGPEVEDDFFNFEALNIPADHPARDMQDTYWLDNGQLLRTHTSPCQIRAMLKFGAPLRAIAPGRCFRNEKIDPSHENTFFQLEGLMIDKNISIANLIYIMKLLVQRILNQDPEIRLRPGYFPFVEPGFELDLRCQICGGKGCPTCKNSGWIEVLPCGMVHPNVLQYGGIDSDVFTGFAFGLGLTRLTMMKYGIKDIRVLNSGDFRALNQFKTL